MKKVLCLLATVLLLCGCSKINDKNYDELINSVVASNYKMENTYRTGYKYYTPTNMDILNTLDYNETLADDNYKYYFYVDVVSYYNRVIEKFKEDVKYITINNEIANHAYNHIWSTKYKNTKVLEEIKKTNDIIYDVTKIKCKYFRPSYGAINKNLRSLIKEEIVMWSLDSRDWKYRNRNSISKIVLNNIKDGDIILMHELNESYESLKIILPKLKKQHYQVVTVSTLNEIRKIRERNV